LRWSEIDLEAGILTIPGERTKNHRTLKLPMPDAAMKIIASVQRMESRDHLFGARATSGFEGWRDGKLDLKDGITEPWKLHDLRRTLVTGMANLGIQPHIIETVVNHTGGGHKSGVAGIYNKATYAREVKTALMRWADHVDNIVNGSARKLLAFPQAK
jgi:integrase